MSDKNQTEQIAIFAGGCFWCMVKPFDQYPGVLQVISGYIGGKTANPNYQEVCAGHTGHKEAVKIIFDPQKISYDQLLRIYWRQINPLDGEGQFADRGSSYSPAIFYTNQEQKQLAEKSKQAIEKQGIFDRPLAVEIVAASPFYPAEEYHQNYCHKEMNDYYSYFIGSGRMDFQKQVWDKNPLQDRNLLQKLTPIQYEVTQNSATEPPFTNPYWLQETEGIYLDIVDNTPLFSSLDKFPCSCGWPSFSKPLDENNIFTKADFSHDSYRIEVRSSGTNSHLGHVFEDGPPEKGGLRYCINSAALRFIAKEDLEKEGYGQYLQLFSQN